jgi:hypothetical protein
MSKKLTLQDSIEELCGLVPEKTLNPLRDADIITIGQLVELPLEKLVGLPNLGFLGAQGLIDALAPHGVTIKCFKCGPKAMRQAFDAKARKKLHPLEDLNSAPTNTRRWWIAERLIFHGALDFEDRHNADQIQIAFWKFAVEMLRAPRPWFSRPGDGAAMH